MALTPIEILDRLVYGMRERAEVVGGRMVLWSKPDVGTEVELSVKGGIAYDVSARRSWLSQILLGDGPSRRESDHK